MIRKILIFFIIMNFNFVNAEIFSQDSNKIFKNLRCLVCQEQLVGYHILIKQFLQKK